MNMRLKILRKQNGYSLDRLAIESDLTKSYLSKVERGLSTPSISASIAIAKALNTDVTELFSESKNELIEIYRGASNKNCKDFQQGEDKRVIEVLASNVANKAMQPFILHPSKTFEEAQKFHEHEGDEFLFVLQGQVEVEFPERTERLQVGDGVYFKSNIPHRVRRVGDAAASALIVVSD
ncbi:Helix-turn-helix family protein [uncultured Thiomicrorhabdus sp.]